jgi:hypothetical protein
MSELLVKCENELRSLAKASKQDQIKIIKRSKKCLIKAISEIVRNCLLGNIPMNSCRKNKLKHYKKLLKSISRRSLPLEKKRTLIIQHGTGFLSLLLPIALETVKILIENLKSKKVNH